MANIPTENMAVLLAMLKNDLQLMTDWMDEEAKAAKATEEAKAACEAKCAEMKAKMDEVMGKWANIGEMTLDEQKDLVLERIAAMGMGEGKCHHEGEEHHCEKPAE